MDNKDIKQVPCDFLGIPLDSMEQHCIGTIEAVNVIDLTKELPPVKWEKEIVQDEKDCTMDNSGIYTMINRRTALVTHSEPGLSCRGHDTIIRVDVMTNGQDPLRTFEGSNPNALRKAVMSWLSGRNFQVSPEHCSYIGYEIHRAHTTKHYVQD